MTRISTALTALLLALGCCAASAQTIGFVMIGAVPIDGLLFEHERAHVRQYCMWGPLFLPVYGLLFLAYGYRRHPFEVAAVKRAGA